MQSENWKDYINRSRVSYMKIGSIRSPNFLFEKIYFGRQRFNHILRKGSTLRSRSEQKRRISLLPNAVRVLSSINSISQYRVEVIKIKNVSSVAHFWSFVGHSVVVVVRQINDVRKHFFSVIPLKKTKTPKGV